ncbi:MAG TPA: NADH-ubiquinone oxidoreductase-F iron-sulfur binding region domain-containing protein [Candidatus Binataceae bacterium]
MAAVVYVPRDCGAVSLGADGVARAIDAEAKRLGIGVQIIRNGSRGMYSHEPMLEAATERGRIAYGPVRESDVPGLLAARLIEGAAHPLNLGPVSEIPYLKNQTRVTFQRMGIVDPLSLDDCLAHGGYAGLSRALESSPEQVIASVERSGLRGRGGAGFPTGRKWRTAYETPADQKYIVCNGDEGDSGTFSDRMIMEGDPFALLEGMTIAAFAAGASRGYIYIRSEYLSAVDVMRHAIGIARGKGYLGGGILGSQLNFDIDIRVGAGSYVCGEETAMLESIEGKRGLVCAKPPVPAVSGLFGKPTIVNNVITFATAAPILTRGADAYAELGTGRSRGTLPVQLAGNVKYPGLIEKPLGVTLREIIHGFGGGTASGRPVRAVQVGGPLGAYFPAELLDTPMDYESIAAYGGILGHGGVVVFDDTVDMSRMARFAMEFCALESCGKCTPCRIGSVRGVEVIDRIIARKHSRASLALLGDLCATMKAVSLCALGGLAPLPVLSAIRHFPEDFGFSRADVAGLR